MPIIFYAVLFVLFAISIRPNKSTQYLDKDSCDVIKGFFIILIVFTHVLDHFPYSGFMSNPLTLFRNGLGQLCVSMFFFISGYGIVYSVLNKGPLYSKSLLINRFLRILFYTIISLIPYFIYCACLGISHSVSDYFLSFIGLSSFGNVSWFIFAILVCYLLCAVVYFFNWSNSILPTLLISIGILLYIIFMFVFGEDAYKWDTIICFIYGMFFYIFKDKICIILNKSKLIPLLSMIVSVGVVSLLQYFHIQTIFKLWFTNFFFCLFFVSLTKLFTLKSYVLSYLGKSSYAIFIMHYLVILCFVDVGSINNEWANYFVLFIASLFIGIPINYIYKIVDLYVISPLLKLYKNNILNRFSEK